MADQERITCWFNMNNKGEKRLWKEIREHAFKNRTGASSYLKELAYKDLK